MAGRHRQAQLPARVRPGGRVSGGQSEARTPRFPLLDRLVGAADGGRPQSFAGEPLCMLEESAPDATTSVGRIHSHEQVGDVQALSFRRADVEAPDRDAILVTSNSDQNLRIASIAVEHAQLVLGPAGILGPGEPLRGVKRSEPLRERGVVRCINRFDDHVPIVALLAGCVGDARRSACKDSWVIDNTSEAYDPEANAGPLSGVRVLDLTSVVMGPLATQILGDLGAEVISIESGRGDTNRGMGAGPVRQLSGVSLNLLRNKRNVAVDLKQPAGRDALLRIAATCDVFVTNLRPGPLARLDLGYEQIAAVRPDVVFCQAQGFPSDGPMADEPAYDDIIQTAGGVLDVVKRATGAAAMMPTLLADKVCGLVLVYAIIAALYHRERTGQGQRLEVPMVDALKAFVLVEHGGGAIGRPPTDSPGYHRILTPFRRPQQSADGWLTIFPYLDSHWELLLRAGGHPELLEDSRLSREGRQLDSGFAYETLEALVRTKTTSEWLSFCRKHAIPASEVAGLDELVEALPDGEHPIAGAYKVIPPPVRFSATPASVRRPAPMIGQHNREVLTEVGIDDAEVTRLEATGVLRSRGSIESLKPPKSSQA
jgi:crotonobetainyl-CoA:carnitine CoA-transferase CaiB-like acyl-CoA transferase